MFHQGSEDAAYVCYFSVSPFCLSVLCRAMCMNVFMEMFMEIHDSPVKVLAEGWAIQSWLYILYDCHLRYTFCYYEKKNQSQMWPS